MTKSTQVGCLIATLLLQVNDAHAQTADVASIPPGNDKIIPVHRGEASPIDGQIFDNDTALRWANWLVQYKNLLKANAELQRKLCTIDTSLASEKLNIEIEKNKKIVPDLEEKLKKAQDEADHPPFYNTFWFGATIGVSVTTAIVTAIALGH